MEGVLLEVEMSIGQAWQHRPPAQVDDLGRRAGQRQDGLVGADGGDPSVSDGEGFGRRPLGVERVDAAAAKQNGRRG